MQSLSIYQKIIQMYTVPKAMADFIVNNEM
jgi:hypothetical protein